MFGLPPGTELTYEAFLDTVHPEDRAYVDREWTAALRGKPYDIEHRILVGDQVKWVHEKAEMEFDAQGELLAGFGMVQDITERKLAEARMAWLASFPEKNQAPITEVDATGRIHYANPAAQRLLPGLAEAGLEHPWLAGFAEIAASLP